MCCAVLVTVDAASSQRRSFFYLELPVTTLFSLSHNSLVFSLKNSLMNTHTHARMDQGGARKLCHRLFSLANTQATYFLLALTASFHLLSATYIHKDPCTHATTATSWSHSTKRTARPIGHYSLALTNSSMHPHDQRAGSIFSTATRPNHACSN